MLTTLARAIVNRYPEPWRERYGDEVLSLIEDPPVRIRDLGELLRGLFVERARALIEDTDHPVRTATLLSLLQPLFVVTFLVTAWSLGLVLRTWRDVPSGPGDIGAWVMVGFLSLYVTAWFVLLYRRRGQPHSDQPFFPAWIGALVLPVLFVGIVLSKWSGWSGWTSPGGSAWLNFYFQTWTYGLAVAELSSSFWPGRRLLRAIGQVAGAENQIKSAQTWVDGCHMMIAQGVASPLDEAMGQVEKFTREREAAVAELQQLGYRARFQP